jgi:hypothetical protein
VGHGLENDWLAVGMGSLEAPAAVIDTACIFSFADATAALSLATLMSTLLLVVSFRAAHLEHDSVSDASAALRLVQQELRNPKFVHPPSQIHRVKIFVRHLDVTVSDEGLRAAFAPFGNVASAKVFNNGRTTGFTIGFVDFVHAKSSVALAIASAAIESMHYTDCIACGVSAPGGSAETSSITSRQANSGLHPQQSSKSFIDFKRIGAFPSPSSFAANLFPRTCKCSKKDQAKTNRLLRPSSVIELRSRLVQRV